MWFFSVHPTVVDWNFQVFVHNCWLKVSEQFCKLSKLTQNPTSSGWLQSLLLLSRFSAEGVCVYKSLQTTTQGLCRQMYYKTWRFFCGQQLELLLKKESENNFGTSEGPLNFPSWFLWEKQCTFARRRHFSASIYVLVIIQTRKAVLLLLLIQC